MGFHTDISFILTLFPSAPTAWLLIPFALLFSLCFHDINIPSPLSFPPFPSFSDFMCVDLSLDSVHKRKYSICLSLAYLTHNSELQPCTISMHFTTSSLQMGEIPTAHVYRVFCICSPTGGQTPKLVPCLGSGE